MTTIAFRKDIKQGRQYDPRQNFELTTIESEIRYDPLTGDSGRLCHFALQTTVPPDLDELVADTATHCPFCPERVLRVTPRFPETLIPEGRFERNNAVLFPNLFPYDDISAVAVISKEHFHPMGDIPSSVIEDGIGIARDFFRRIETDHSAQLVNAFGIANWNYMPPAGGTQVHPHMQVIYTGNPGNRLRRELIAEQAYWDRHGRTYMADLLAAEKAEGVRWIGETGSVSWLTPFVPTGILGDCIAVFPGRATLNELSDAEIAHFAIGLRKILRSFAAIGLWGFNLVFFPDTTGSKADVHWLNARLAPRLYLNPVTHVPDVSYLQLQMEERFAMIFPEETAARLRKDLRSMGQG